MENNYSDNRVCTVGFFYENPANEFENDVKMAFKAFPDMHIATFHKLCRRFALAIGYAESSVDEYFGDEQEDPFL